MSLTTANESQRIKLLAKTLVRLLQEIPGLGLGTMITVELVNQVKKIINKNLNLLAGSTLITAGVLTLLPTLILIAVNILGFTSAGVLQGKYLQIYTT